jgi:hypothetical protein
VGFRVSCTKIHGEKMVVILRTGHIVSRFNGIHQQMKAWSLSRSMDYGLKIQRMWKVH